MKKKNRNFINTIDALMYGIARLTITKYQEAKLQAHGISKLSSLVPIIRRFLMSAYH
jgi:hypothetical protein